MVSIPLILYCIDTKYRRIRSGIATSLLMMNHVLTPCIYKKILQISQIVLKRFLKECVGINNVSDKIALSRNVRTGTSLC